MGQYFSSFGYSQFDGSDQAQTMIPTSFQDSSHQPNEQLSAPTAVLLNEFLSKTRPLSSSERNSIDKDDAICTLCFEPFLFGKNPEIPIKLKGCGHIFGMNCILKWLSPFARKGHNSCPECREPVVDHWDRIDLPAARHPARRRTTRAPNVGIPNHPVRVRWAATVPAGAVSDVSPRTSNLTAATAEPDAASTTTSPMAATQQRAARSTPTSSPTVAMQEAQRQRQAIRVRENPSRIPRRSPHQMTSAPTYPILEYGNLRRDSVEDVSTLHIALAEEFIEADAGSERAESRLSDGEMEPEDEAYFSAQEGVPATN